MQLGLRHKVLLVIAIPLAFELAFIAGLGILLDAAYKQNDRIQHCRDVVAASNRVINLFYESTRFLAFYSIRHDQSARARIDDTISQIPKTFAEMKRLARNNPKERKAIEDADSTARQLIEQFNALFSKIDEEGFDLTGFATARESRVKMQETLEELAQQLTAINERESAAQKVSPEDIERSRLLISELLLAGIVINTVTALITAFAFSKTILDKFEILSSNAQRFSQRQPLLKPIDGRDEISRFDQAFHDMTRKLQELERQESAMIANAVDVICSLTAAGDFTAVSPSSVAVLGYAPEELVGGSVGKVIADGDDADRVVEKLKTHRTVELSAIHESGRLVDTVWSTQWVEEKQELFCTVHDISEKKRVERLKRELIGMVSHDLRTPLSSIRALFELLTRHTYGQINEKGLKRIASLDMDTLRLIQLINDLLDLEKMESGKLELRHTNCYMDEVAGRALESVIDLAERQQLEVKSDMESLLVSADPARIIQVIVNFLSNAVKFSQSGKRIWLRVKQDGQFVKVSVEDEAGGIAEGMEKKIFERFEQSSAEHAKLGSGLGLSIAQTIIELHGGTIGVTNKSGIGAEFWFVIPLVADATPQSEPE